VITINYEVDVTNCYVAEWKNDVNLYNYCGEFVANIPQKTKGVYYIYRNNDLLYVGCTTNFRQRIVSHLVRGCVTKEYINEATRIICEVIDDKSIREQREYDQIVALKPKHNKQLPRIKQVLGGA
jgi:predicted GIY-YIG superfamily endonuclease